MSRGSGRGPASGDADGDAVMAGGAVGGNRGNVGGLDGTGEIGGTDFDAVLAFLRLPAANCP